MFVHVLHICFCKFSIMYVSMYGNSPQTSKKTILCCINQLYCNSLVTTYTTVKTYVTTYGLGTVEPMSQTHCISS